MSIFKFFIIIFFLFNFSLFGVECKNPSTFNKNITKFYFDYGAGKKYFGIYPSDNSGNVVDVSGFFDQAQRHHKITQLMALFIIAQDIDINNTLKDHSLFMGCDDAEDPADDLTYIYISKGNSDISFDWNDV